MTSVRKILVPVDFSPGADAALETAASFALKLEAELLVLHVWQPPPYVVPEMVVSVPGGDDVPFDDYMKSRTRADLDAFCKPHRQSIHVPFHSFVESGTPKQVILQFAKTHSVDLVVMGTHGHTGFMHVLMGSVAEHVVRHQPCPVMTVRHPHDER